MPNAKFLLILFAFVLMTCCAPLGGAEDEDDGYKFSPFTPAFRPNEQLDYSVYWNGLKVGNITLKSGDKPGKDEPYRYYFSSKSTRLGKIIFRFFSTTANSQQSTEDGSSLEFFRHMARDDRFLEERVKFNYKTMDLHQIISHERGRRPVERYRLIEDKMLDPVTMLWHFRSVKIEKSDERRSYHLFADGFFDVAVGVTGRKTKEFDHIGKREVWTATMVIPKVMLSFKTGTFSLEIDVATGIILNMSWEDSGGSCKAVLVSAKNSPLPFADLAHHLSRNSASPGLTTQPEGK
ncbi:MAG: hypothetical protein Kow00107_08970 [Planctomycetota bacterium]